MDSIYAASMPFILALSVEHSDRGLGIDRDEFDKGYTLYAFNFTPDLTCGDVYTRKNWKPTYGN